MSKQAIFSNYDNFDEDKRAYGNRAEHIEFIYTKKLLEEYVTASMSVVELGCGTGYYGLFLSDKCRSYHGIDLTPRHIEQFQRKIDEQGLKGISAAVGDATHLPEIADGTFDVVLVFGPMYHLPREERAKVIRESKRICKPGGLIMFAYINKIGAYLRACLDPKLKAPYPNKRTNEFVFKHGTDDLLPDVFFFTMPEEIESDMVANDLTVVRNAGVDFLFDSTDFNSADEEKYAAWREIMDFMFHSGSCTGVSNHAVILCRN